LIDIKQHFALFIKSAKTHEARFAIRALRAVSSLRKRLTSQILAQTIASCYVKGKFFLLPWLQYAKDPTTTEQACYWIWRALVAYP
jgi:phosphopantetheine adenylyltransferase